MIIEKINPDSNFSMPTISQMAIVSSTKLIFSSGQVAWDKDGNIVGHDDLYIQTVQVFKNISNLLKEADATPSNIVRLTVYVVDYKPEHSAILADAASQHIMFGDKPPAMTLIGVQALAQPEILIEIEVIAAV